MPLNRQKQAPWDFDCPYKNSCPHLEGLSTHWVWEEYQNDEHLEHWKIRDMQAEELEKALEHIVKLEEENEELKAKLKALHSRQFKANKKSAQKPTDNTGENEEHSNKIKKRGAPKGHPGWYRRKPDHIDETIIVPAPDKCPNCSCDALIPIEETKNHLQEDIVLQPKTRVTNFKHQQAFCPKCDRPVIANHKSCCSLFEIWSWHPLQKGQGTF